MVRSKVALEPAPPGFQVRLSGVVRERGPQVTEPTQGDPQSVKSADRRVSSCTAVGPAQLSASFRELLPYRAGEPRPRPRSSQTLKPRRKTNGSVRQRALGVPTQAPP